jgi:hypothetical protein
VLRCIPNVQLILPPLFLPRALARYKLRLEAGSITGPSMAPYYIDPGRCFEVPFRIPLPDKDAMAARLASIRLIMRNARERQSLTCAEHRRKRATRFTRYRDKAKAIMECGKLKPFVGNLTEHYFDYVEFHQECLNDISPLTIQVPSLGSPLSPPPPCLLYVVLLVPLTVYINSLQRSSKAT